MKAGPRQGRRGLTGTVDDLASIAARHDSRAGAGLGVGRRRGATSCGRTRRRSPCSARIRCSIWSSRHSRRRARSAAPPIMRARVSKRPRCRRRAAGAHAPRRVALRCSHTQRTARLVIVREVKPPPEDRAAARRAALFEFTPAACVLTDIRRQCGRGQCRRGDDGGNARPRGLPISSARKPRSA